MKRGAYVLADLGQSQIPDRGGKPQIILMANGSEVGLIVQAGQRLAGQGLAVRLVSFQSWELFAEQEPAYRDEVLPPDIEPRLAVEAGISQGWHRWVGLKGHVLGIDRYGASAPANTVFEKLGLTVDNAVQIAEKPEGSQLFQEKHVNTTQELHAAGQSVWYDNIQRSLLCNGELAGMIERGEIRGVTSNPTIFMNAITKSQDYDAGLVPLARADCNADEIFWQLAVEDIQAAADLFRPLYQQSGGGDGFVSLEVSPYLAQDTDGTLAEAKRLWQRVARPNLLVKIPATKAGLPAVTAAIAAGINVNVTLIFSRERYADVMDAYLKGLEQRVAQGLPISSIASVTSFFVSRVDTKVDGHLAGMIDRGGVRAEKAATLLGKAAIANARLAYADFKQVFATDRFQALNAQGARVQRPLWASTGTKNPEYSDVMYVEELIGPDTVNTVPPQTLAAFLDHGQVRPSLEENVAGSRQALADLEALGIAMSDVTRELEAEGVKSFADAFTALLSGVDARRKAASPGNP